jgi:hypothetical protein
MDFAMDCLESCLPIEFFDRFAIRNYMPKLPKCCQICAVKTEPAREPKVKQHQKRPPWPKVRQVDYKNGTKAWVVDGRIMRNRKVFGSRYFFKTKAQADTKADQLRTQRKNEGVSALSLSAADRIDAEAAPSLLAPHRRSLREAAEFFIKHLWTFGHPCLLQALTGSARGH